MPPDDDVPLIRQVVLDCSDPRALAEFWRQLLGYEYRPGDEPPAAGEPDPRGDDWLVLRPDRDDTWVGRDVAFQFRDDYTPPVWDGPDGAQQQMAHLDMTVPDVAALQRQRDRAVGLGATLRLDRSEDPEEPLYVFTDPAGHPFCIFVA